MIDHLINKQDNFEIVRDQIAAILVTEIESQKALALIDNEDEALWDMRVYTERSNPWEDFPPRAQDKRPLINVWFEDINFEKPKSQVIDRQNGLCRFNVDVYGFGQTSSTESGHDSGDKSAVFETHRAVRLVRNILMADTYTYLGLRGLVWGRWPEAIRVFQPREQAAEHVVGARLTLEVSINEFAPQYTPVDLEYVAIEVNRADDGLIFLASYNYSNVPPIISGTPDTSVDQDEEYSFTPSAYDPNGDPLTFSVLNAPSWANFNPATGQLSGTPTNEDVGATVNIEISVTDGAMVASLAPFSIVVNNVNDAPVISGVPTTTVDEDVAYSFTPTVTDIDVDDTLTFSIVNKPSWANFNTATGQLSGTPANEDVGTTAGIIISVTDGTVTDSLAAFDIEVINVNDAPIISGTPSTSVDGGEAYSFIPTASDVDVGDTLTFSIVNKPSWASFNTSTGELSGTPTGLDAGTTVGIVISVTDGTVTESLAPFDLEVVPWSPLNDSPVMWIDASDPDVITVDGGLVSLITDKSTAGNDATQSTVGKRPTLNTAGAFSFLEFDNSNDSLTYDVGTFTGQIGIATTVGTYVADCAYTGSFNMPTQQPLDIVMIVIAPSINEAKFKEYAATRGAVADFTGYDQFLTGAFSYRTDITAFRTIDTSSVRAVDQAWKFNTSMVSFPPLDFSASIGFSETWRTCVAMLSFPMINLGTANSLYYTWNGCNQLTSFPLLDTSNIRFFQNTWQNCSKLQTFPQIDTSAAENLSNTWRGCKDLISFPALDYSACTSLFYAWRDCSSLANFPANVFDNTPCTVFNSAFTNTNLTQVSIDNILVSLNVANTSNGIFDQTGGSAPSAVGEAAITALRGRGWTINVTGGF